MGVALVHTHVPDEAQMNNHHEVEFHLLQF